MFEARIVYQFRTSSVPATAREWVGKRCCTRTRAQETSFSFCLLALTRCSRTCAMCLSFDTDPLGRGPRNTRPSFHIEKSLTRFSGGLIGD